MKTVIARLIMSNITTGSSTMSKATSAPSKRVQKKSDEVPAAPAAAPAAPAVVAASASADKKVKNPETGKMIKVKSALKYDKQSPVYKATVAMIKNTKK